MNPVEPKPRNYSPPLFKHERFYVAAAFVVAAIYEVVTGNVALGVTSLAVANYALIVWLYDTQ